MKTSELIVRIEEHCRRTGESETAFGLRAVNDGKLLTELRAGRSITLKTLERIEGALAVAIEARRIPLAVNQ